MNYRNNLAVAYSNAGRLDEAIPLYERALNDRIQLLGWDRHDTLTSMLNLTDAYAELQQARHEHKVIARGPFNLDVPVPVPGHDDEVIRVLARPSTG